MTIVILRMHYEIVFCGEYFCVGLVEFTTIGILVVVDEFTWTIGMHLHMYLQVCLYQYVLKFTNSCSKCILKYDHILGLKV